MNTKPCDAIDLELPIAADTDKLDRLKDQVVLLKYGGNAMVNDDIKQGVVEDIISLKKVGAIPVIVHGGGPAIQKLLDEVGVQSEFVEGHRKTDKRTMGYVEMALSGSVNADIVTLLNRSGIRAVGLSGKDGEMVVARKRRHSVTIDGEEQETDLGHVGDVDRIDTRLVQLLLKEGYIPVISPVAAGDDLDDYNVNADMFAGHMAGALEASHYVAMTNVAGIQLDPEDPATLVKELSVQKAEAEIGNAITGGMIPKTESCIIALKEGALSAHIINGTQPHSLLRELMTEERTGTLITK